MNTFKLSVLTLLAAITIGQAHAQDPHAGHHPQGNSAATDGVGVSTRSDMEMTEGTIRKIDPSQGKVTLKHGEIKNLQMPPMTMVFKAGPNLLNGLQAGDEVRFMVDANMNILHIEKK